MIEDKNNIEFDYKANNTQLAIQARVQSYMDMLHGVGALFYTDNDITRAQFHSYVKELDLEQRFPGITSLNFAPRVFARNKEKFEAAVRADTGLDTGGYPKFSILPSGERTEYHVLTYLEPMETNLVSFGFDIASNKLVANALAVSRDSGELISSGKLIRIRGQHQHIGMAMRIPLYRRGMPRNTVDERRAAYFGSVGAGFDISKLLLRAVDKDTLRYTRFKLYDVGRRGEQNESGTTDPEHILFDSEAATGKMLQVPISMAQGDFFTKRVSMTVGSRVWEMEFSANKETMLDGFETYLPGLVLGSGLLATFLLYSIYYSLTSARRRALELANDMTKDLRASETSLGEAQHMAHLGSWVLDPSSGQMTWSEETFRIFGFSHTTMDVDFDDFLRRIHENDRQLIKDGLAKSVSSGEEFSSEHRVMQHDGTQRWVQTIARPGHNGHEVLLRGAIMDVTERKEAVEALKRSQELLRELTAYQDRIKEDERKRIAREIHDELGQTLLALRIDVSMLEARTGGTHPRLNQKVHNALTHIDATVKTIRTIINNLRPAVLDLGLTAAIEWQVNDFKRRSGIACELVMGAAEFPIDDARATSLFRILQESLTNVIRHANASHVVIKLYQDGGQLVMKITDNGVGIYPDRRKKRNSFGLVGVEERIYSLNGKFLINSAPGKGTMLTIFIPLQSADSGLDDTT